MNTEQLLVNKRCVVRDRPCGRYFGGANTCFVACPSSEDVALEIEILRAVLQEEEVEAYIAVEHFESAMDIFCTKICTKIIEARFCIVLLSGSTNEEGIVAPNPNVYYEYGLMTAWQKSIIPMQRDGQKLAFNIQSLDTIKYSSGNFKTKVHHAIRSVMGSLPERYSEQADSQVRNIISHYFELCGYHQLSGNKKTWSIAGTQFLSFSRFQYATLLTSAADKDRVEYDLKIITRRLENFIRDKTRQRQDLENQLEVVSKPAKVLKLNNEIRRLSSLVEGATKPVFTVVVLHDDDVGQVGDITFGESTLESELDLLTATEMKKRIDESSWRDV